VVRLLAGKREGGWLGFKRRGPIFELSSTLFGIGVVGGRKVWVERWVKVE
jgi:hypothetical protein